LKSGYKTVRLLSCPASHLRFSTLLAIVFAVAPISTYAQQRGRARPKLPAPAAQAKDAARARRAQAVDLLNETAYAARSFDDLFYRARVQTLAADALWPSDEERARAIFRRAWDAATAADKAEREADEAESGLPPSATAAAAAGFVSESRDEVLVKVATRDAQLAGVFLQEYLKDREGDKSEARNRSQRRTPWGELSPGGARRLALAFDLLGRNEPERAAQIAMPLAGEGVSGDLMAFILHLREQSASAADALYLHLLKRTRTDQAADANSVLLLSSPIVSPQLLVVVDESGSLQFRPLARPAKKPQALPPIDDATRKLFYNVAATVLARPVVPRADANPLREAVTLYFTIGRLLAHFEREAAQYAPEMRARQGALLNEIEASRRDQLSAQFELSSLTPERTGDPLRPQMEKLARAGDEAERDRISLAIVKTAAQNRLWDRARRAASEIKDAGAQRAALSFIAVNQIADISRAYADDKEDDFEGLATFVRGVDAQPFAVAWGLAQTAIIAARAGKTQAVSDLLDDAERYSARINMGTRQRVAAYASLTTYAARLDQARAWRLLSDVVKAANAVEDLAGDEASLNLGADENPAEPDAGSSFSIEADTFRLDRIFATMARLDFEKAVTEARGLRGKVPQALAHIAAARATLESSRQ
jgi:hypothetical protein